MTDLVPIENLSLTAGERYRPMLDLIDRSRPGILAAVAQHGKSHTQFQYAMLDNAGPIAGPTKLRNMRQILAVIDRTEAALEETYHKQRQDECRVRMFREKGGELMELKAQQLESQLRRSQSSIQGSIRKLAAYYEQYQNLESQLKEELGKDEITEADFEADEERFHIMKAFEQALCAARSNGGKIDHGNLIYFHDIGINGRLAQEEITRYFQTEQDQCDNLSVHQMHELECSFLEAMAEVFKGCGAAYAKRKGLLTGLSQVATLGYQRESETSEDALQ